MAVLALCVAACTPIPASTSAAAPACTGPASPTATAEPLHEESATTPHLDPAVHPFAIGDFEVASTMRTADARPAVEGVDYRTEYSVPLVDPSGQGTFGLSVGTVDSRCVIVATRVPPVINTEALIGVGQEIGLYDGANFAPFANADSTGGARQITSAARRGNLVIWDETHSTNLDDEDWLLRMHDLSSDTTTSLADSSEFFGVAAPPGFALREVDPDLSTHQIIWNSGGVKSSDFRTPQVLRLDLRDPHSIEVLATGTMLHAADADAVYVANTKTLDSREEYEVVRYGDDGTNRVVVSFTVPVGRAVGRIAVDGSHVAWLVTAQSDAAGASTHDAQVYVLDIASRAATVIQAADDGLGELDMEGDVLWWGSGSGNGDGGAYRYQLGSAAPTLVTTAFGASRIAASSAVASWAEVKDGLVDYKVARWQQ